MREYGAVVDNTRGASSRFDFAIEWLIVALLAFMPLAFGVVHAWSEEIVIVLSGTIVICFLLKILLERNQNIIWSWSYVPIGLFILIGILQLIPLSTSFLNVISPNTVALKTELLNDLPNADNALKSMTLSFYPNATKQNLRVILAIAGLFFVVFNVFKRPDQIKRLLTAIVVIGGVIAVIDLAQNVFGNEKIYWFVPTHSGGAHSGPFVNHSNYGQFMNLSIGAVLGCLCVKLHEIFAGRTITPSGVFEFLSSRSAKLLWLLVIVMGLCAASIFISLTRGGVISMLIAMAFTTLLFVSQRSLRSNGWIIVIMFLVAFACVLYIGFDAIYERLVSLRDFDKAQAGRLQILRDIWVMCTKFPIFGTGLGTHFVVYPMFDRSTITALAAHAENEYAQAAEETGLAGLSTLIIFGIIVGRNYIRSIFNTKLSIRLAAYGLGFGILAILIHSLTDFGQHLPANATLSAIFCALLLVLARQEEIAHHERKITRVRGYKAILPCSLLMCAVVISIWSIVGADNARVAQAHWKKALNIEEDLADRKWEATEQEYADLISFAAAASAREPENIEYLHWLNVYRWRSICQAANPDTGEIIKFDEFIPTIRDIVAEFHKALVICPTYGPTYSMVGQIEKAILNDDSGAERIRKGFRLAPCDPIACYVAGWLDVTEGKTQDCMAKFERAVQLDHNLFADVVDIYVNQLSRPHLAISASGDDIGRLSYVANVLEDMYYNDLAKQTREKIKNLLEVKCSKPDAPASAFASLGNIYRKQQNNEAAIKCYRRALMLDYSQVYWRLELAKLLVKAEKIPEAMHEARICLQMRPQLKDAEMLVTNCSVNQAVFKDEN